VADQFADAKLALGAACGLIAILVAWHYSFLFFGHARAWLGIHLSSVTIDLAAWIAGSFNAKTALRAFCPVMTKRSAVREA
jgi:hypothetical protein